MEYSEDYYKGIAGIYFDRVINIVINMGKLKQEEGLILDFGCGIGHLKEKLKSKNIVGYDIIEKLSDVKDYTKLKPAVIVCNAVLEHLDENELKEAIINFRKMNNKAKLITSVPTENLISKIGMYLTGLDEAHYGHKIKIKQVNKHLSKECNLLKRKRIFTMMETSLWGFKENVRNR